MSFMINVLAFAFIVLVGGALLSMIIPSLRPFMLYPLTLKLAFFVSVVLIGLATLLRFLRMEE